MADWTSLIPVIGPWAKDEWLLLHGTHLAIVPRMERCWFALNPGGNGAVLVLDLVLENRLSQEIWIKEIHQEVLRDGHWHVGKQWAGNTYGVSWAIGYAICGQNPRLDLKVTGHLAIRGHGSDGGCTVFTFDALSADLPRIRCKVVVATSRGAPVVQSLDVVRHENERRRSRVRIKGPVQVQINGRKFEYPASEQNIPRFVFEAIQGMNIKQQVELIRHWELT